MQSKQSDLTGSPEITGWNRSCPSWEGRVAVVILVVQVLLVSLGVISRHFSTFLVGRSLSLSFTEELSRYLLAWVTAFGLCAVLRDEGLLSLRIWPERLAKLRRILPWVAAAATLALAMLIVVHGARVVALHWETDRRTGVMGWPMIWVTVSLPLGMALICWRIIHGWWAARRGSQHENLLEREER